MTRNLYKEVADRIIAELETGHAPWVKPWSATAGRNMPANAVTGRPYSGVNVIMLWTAMSAHAWATPRFLTFKQAKDAGGHVRAGEKGTKVYFVKQLTKKGELPTDGETGEGATEDRTFTMLREFTVFNVAQCDGLPEKFAIASEGKARHTDERDATIDEFVAATGAEIRDTGGDRAFYAPGPDRIEMPLFKAFRSASHYYGVLFHEMGHWTGHKSRLAREFGKRFGDYAYAAEELVAELTSAFLAAEFDIDGDLRHASYIASWIDMLKADPKAFFTAASKAQAAADYLRGLALAEPAKVAA